jgi:hypothetical protein
MTVKYYLNPHYTTWHLPFSIGGWMAEHEKFELLDDEGNQHPYVLPDGLYIDIGFLCWNFSIDIEW